MAYDNTLEKQRAALIAALGAGSERKALPELISSWLSQNGYTQNSMPSQLEAYAKANGLAMTQAERAVPYKLM